MIPQNNKDIIIFDTVSKESFFLVQGDKSERLLEKYTNREDGKYISLQIGDTVEFQDFVTISNKNLTGVIKKVGWSIGPGGPYITCGIKVDKAKFGTALLYNYTKSPISLTKVKS